MLKFYALFKQSTEGKCTQPKPAFWAVVNKAKWDAWKALGNMPKEEAMRLYVEELKQVFFFLQSHTLHLLCQHQQLQTKGQCVLVLWQ